MSVSVSVHSYAHSVTYVAENVLKSLKNIIVLSGLNPKKLTDDWGVLHRGLQTWITSGHLVRIVLEIYSPSSNDLVIRWDVDISYNYNGEEGNFFVDTDQLKYAIKKAGLVPGDCNYRVVVTTKDGRPDVDGWSSCTLRSTQGFIKQSLGTTVDHSGLSAGASYYRKQE